MITYHHIGGRNGTYPFPLKKGPLLQDFHLVLYDADAHCLEHMKAKGHEAWGEVSIYPYCIGEKTGKGTFYLNFHPTTNSLYPFNDAYKDYNFVSNPIYGEYAFGDACKSIRTIQIDLFSLEDALHTSKIPQIDFLSLDVQGAEYDILSGAKHMLQKSCIGVQLEVEFVKLYQDQKTFSDIHIFMEGLGFELLELDSFGRCAPISLPIGFRGLEQPLYAEAVYIKSFDQLIKINDFEQLCKAALLSLAYKKLGLCFKILNKAFENNRSYQTKEPLYIRFLSEIYTLFKEHAHLKFPKLSHLFTHERFQNFYGLNKTIPIAVQDEVRRSEVESVEHTGLCVNTRDKLQHSLNLKSDGYISHHTESEVMKSNIQALLHSVQEIEKLHHSPLETILKAYGLEEVAEVAKKTRLFETRCFSELSSSV